MLGWWNDIQLVHLECRLFLVTLGISVERDGDRFVLTERHLTEAIPSVFRCPHHHVALACGEERATLSIGVFGDCRIELGVVIDLEVHSGFLHGPAFRIVHHEVDAGS